MLTTLQIKSAKPAERAYKLADTGGLFVLVQPNGSKLWRYKFRLDGVEGLQALGAFPEVTLADARNAHAESRKQVAKGVHPVQARRDERESRAQAELHRVKGSFGAVCADWNATTGADLRPATVLQRNREIEKDLTPRFKERPISKITRLELTTALKEVEARAPEVARNLRNYLWGIFEYAIDSGLIADNPVPPVRVLRKRNQENHPALSPDLLGEFLRKLDSIDTIHEQTRIAMLLVVLTACRKAEVTGGKWSEIDLKAAEWEIPADRMKAAGLASPPFNVAHEFTNRLRGLAVAANQSIEAGWNRFVAENTPSGSDDVLEALGKLPQMRAGVTRIRQCRQKVTALAATVPADPASAIEQLRVLSAEHGSAWAELTADSVPPSVLQFLRACAADGAPVTTLTDEVRVWLESRGLLGSFRVRIG